MFKLENEHLKPQTHCDIHILCYDIKYLYLNAYLCTPNQVLFYTQSGNTLDFLHIVNYKSLYNMVLVTAQALVAASNHCR